MAAEVAPSTARRERRQGPRRWLIRVVAFLSGGLGFLVFPAPDLADLSWVVLVPMLLLVRAAASWREAALRGWLSGAGFLAATQYWLAPNLTVFFPLVVALLALLWTGFGVLVHLLLRGPVDSARAGVAVIGVPAAWVLIEVARSWQWLGGPWALLGASQWQHPAVLALAALGGVWLVSFAIVAVNTAVALLIVGGTPARSLAAVVAVAGVVAGPATFAIRHAPPVTEIARIAVVQPGVLHGGRLASEERLTAELSGPVELVVWGESSVGYDLTARPDLLRRLTSLSQRVGADLLVGVDARDSAGVIAKSATLLDRAGIRATYQKTRLVPFGEYVPFRGALGWLSGITAAAAQNRRPGHRLVIMSVHGLAIGPLTSFEETFPDMARTEANRGARILVYQSSTSTFQGSWAPAQLASVGALRAAETGRPVVQAALTGVSAAYDALGRRIAWLDTRQRGALVVDVPEATSSTPYDRFGNYVPEFCAVLLTLLALTRLAASVRQRRAP